MRDRKESAQGSVQAEPIQTPALPMSSGVTLGVAEAAAGLALVSWSL